MASAARSTDTPQKARDRLNAFHEARSEYDALAARLIERMEKDGLVGQPDHVGRR